MNETNDKNIAVVHLVWLPYGIELYKNFIQSYINFSAGYEHELILLFNGVNDKIDLNPYFDYACTSKVKYNFFSLKEGQDIKAYIWICNKLSDYTHILFLNSFSKILSNDWLLYYVNAIEVPQVGLVGATGSWESHYTDVFKKYKIAFEFNQSFKYNFRKYKLFFKAIFYWRFLFCSFPSPHIRTTGFIINRSLFLQLKRNKINSKFDAYLFENGKQSMTKQIIKRGYKVLVVNNFGKVFTPEKWYNSKTFWSFNQENLLISDNQTEKYQNVEKDEQKKYTLLAWGKFRL